MNDDSSTKKYYDDFSVGYEARRGANVPRGYHDLLDHLESDLVRRYGEGREVLEVGCGTGLVLSRISEFASRAAGIDLSPGMLEHARARGLQVSEGSATELPFADSSFDVTCSFKVLPHVPNIELALDEMARVTRPGGHILAGFYNPQSIRGLLRRSGPARKVGQAHKESDVFTRFDNPSRAEALAPSGTKYVGSRGIRILTPTAGLIDSRIVGPFFYRLEVGLADGPLKRFAGFFVAIYQKDR